MGKKVIPFWWYTVDCFTNKFSFETQRCNVVNEWVNKNCLKIKVLLTLFNVLLNHMSQLVIQLDNLLWSWCGGFSSVHISSGCTSLYFCASTPSRTNIFTMFSKATIQILSKAHLSHVPQLVIQLAYLRVRFCLCPRQLRVVLLCIYTGPHQCLCVPKTMHNTC